MAKKSPNETPKKKSTNPKEKNLGKTSTGIQTNVAGLLCYVLGFITGVIFYILEKENKFVRFHAMQSILLFGFLSAFWYIIRFVPFIGLFLAPIFAPIVSILGLILWIILMVKAYQGEYYKIPIAGDIAEKTADNIK